MTKASQSMESKKYKELFTKTIKSIIDHNKLLLSSIFRMFEKISKKKIQLRS